MPFSSNRSVKTGLVAAAVLATALVGGAAFRLGLELPHGLGHPQATNGSPPAPQATAPAAPPAPSESENVATAEPPAPPGVEQVPEAENPPPVIGEIRQSMGHAAGLHRTRDPLGLSASAAYVVDASNGAVLAKKNEDAILPMASLTKMMTGLLTVEAKLPMDEVIAITQDDVDMERHSRSRLKVGTTLTRSEALHLALMSSENRAAHALGRTFPGGLAQFVNAMNNRARQIGMKSTTYVDPTGLSSKNQSTAHDLSLLALQASKQPLLREYTTTPRLQVALGQKTLQYINSNSLVRGGKWDIEFQKTGYIVEAGMCMVVRTRTNGRDVLMVLMDSGSKKDRIVDAERVKRWVVAQSGENDTLATARGRHAAATATATAVAGTRS